MKLLPAEINLILDHLDSFEKNIFDNFNRQPTTHEKNLLESVVSKLNKLSASNRELTPTDKQTLELCINDMYSASGELTRPTIMALAEYKAKNNIEIKEV